MPKLILLNGGVGIGKSTLTQRYLKEHALALGIDGDAFMGMLGRWLAHEDEARKIVIQYTQKLADAHLQTGHDVVLPFLLLDSNHAELFESIAKSHSAQFYEILLYAEKEDAIKRALIRGKWGEPGSPPLTVADRPILEDLYAKMMRTVVERPNTIQIPSVNGAIDATYRQFMMAIS